MEYTGLLVLVVEEGVDDGDDADGSRGVNLIVRSGWYWMVYRGLVVVLAVVVVVVLRRRLAEVGIRNGDGGDDDGRSRGGRGMMWKCRCGTTWPAWTPKGGDGGQG